MALRFFNLVVKKIGITFLPETIQIMYKLYNQAFDCCLIQRIRAEDGTLNYGGFPNIENIQVV
jgi:hypothetical protein